MVSVKFPFSQRLPDYGPCPLSLLKCSHSLVVLCNEYIGELKLGSASVHGAVSQRTCHQNPLCAALYNQHFHQVQCECGLSVCVAVAVLYSTCMYVII